MLFIEGYQRQVSLMKSGLEADNACLEVRRPGSGSWLSFVTLGIFVPFCLPLFFLLQSGCDKIRLGGMLKTIFL